MDDQEKALKQSKMVMWSLVAVGIILIGLIIVWFSQELKRATSNSSTTAKATIIPAKLTRVEQAQIERWITRYGLNQYGDPANTEYNLDPLVDPLTGDILDRYTYIVRKHPNRPWLPPSPSPY